MAKTKQKDGDICYLMTALSATFRATAEFIAEKDRVMKDNFQPPFDHWAHGQSQISLIANESRQVMLFQTNRFVAKAEGYPSLQPFEQMVTIAQNLSKIFKISEVWSVLFHSVRTTPMGSFKEARKRFADKFFTEKTLNLFSNDEYSDFGLVVEHRLWPANAQFRKISKPQLAAKMPKLKQLAEKNAELLIFERVDIGPVSKDEIIDRGVWVEFHEKAGNGMYKTTPAIPGFAILADLKFEARRKQETEFLSTEILWNFYEWARRQADEVWGKIGDE